MGTIRVSYGLPIAQSAGDSERSLTVGCPIAGSYPLGLALESVLGLAVDWRF